MTIENTGVAPYHLETGKYSKRWTLVDDEDETFDSLAEAIEDAEDSETFGEKYEYRVVDAAGTVLWHQVNPHEGVRVNVYDPDPGVWLEKIRADYGINSALWAKACSAWIAQH